MEVRDVSTRYEPQLSGCRARLVITEGDLELFARDCTTIDSAKVWAKKWRDADGMMIHFGSPAVATIYDDRGHPRRRAKIPWGDPWRLRWEWL